jgi:hypothetical protein
MPQTPYFVRTISLATIIPLGAIAGQLAPQGMKVTDVGILSLPAGAAGAIFLHLGQKGDAIPLHLIGQNFHLAEPEDTGIWVTVPAAVAGTSVDFLLGLLSEVRADS